MANGKGDPMINLSETPFSCYGAYFCVRKEAEQEEAFWVYSLHGISQGLGGSLSFTFTVNGKVVRTRYSCDGDKITIYHADRPGMETALVELSFGSGADLCISSKFQKAGVLVDTHPRFASEPVVAVGMNSAVINSYKNKSKYLLTCSCGRMTISQYIDAAQSANHPSGGKQAKIQICGKEQGLCIHLVDVTENEVNIREEEHIQESQTFDDWLDGYGKFYDLDLKRFPMYGSDNVLRISVQETMKKAIYILWSSYVYKGGFLKRGIIYSSNRDFPGIWSWDNGFISAALAPVFPKLAYDELAVFFDYQSESGQLPDSVSDSCIGWNYCKPPVTGWFLLQGEDWLKLSEEQTQILYQGVARQVHFYDCFKDMNQDGICEYRYGNDSGQDNSTLFDSGEAVDSPDLNAWLICCEDWLSVAAKRLGKSEEAVDWKNRADHRTERFLEYFIPALNKIESVTFSDTMQDTLWVAFCGAQRTPMRFRTDAMRNITDAPKRPILLFSSSVGSLLCSALLPA
jgi:hypothetical protein